MTYGVLPSGRHLFQWVIDLGKKSFTASNFKSGCQGCSLQEAFENLLVFLSAFADANRPNHRYTSANSDLFPKQLGKWAYLNSEEIAMYVLELKETKGLIEE